ncbi:DUF6213 family protein [Kitasatospora sp. NPDC059673]|uniref:DUF6213 family protein n=1 Tax=Kitasatospora sp. NPDC059673 TaxID=3346901 RepID=UPI003687363F
MDNTPEPHPGELRRHLPIDHDASTGEMVVPAADVSGLLRAAVGQRLTWERNGDCELAPQTVALLGGALAGLADQIDVACIAAAS